MRWFIGERKRDEGEGEEEEEEGEEEGAPSEQWEEFVIDNFISIRFNSILISSSFWYFALAGILINNHVFAFTQLRVPIWCVRTHSTFLTILHTTCASKRVYMLVFYIDFCEHQHMSRIAIPFAICTVRWISFGSRLDMGQWLWEHITIATVSIETTEKRSVTIEIVFAFVAVISTLHKINKNKQRGSRKIFIGDGRMRKTILAKQIDY